MVSNPVRLPPALLFLKNTRVGEVHILARTKAYLVLILSVKSYQTCLHKGRLEASLCLSRATALCTPHKQ